MKNQYFGDRNDMFKYDLALTLVERLDAVSGFTFVPMLTPDDGRSDGSLTDYRQLGRHRPSLYGFLGDCVADPSRRGVTSLRRYMAENAPAVRYHPHMDDAVLCASNRGDYFAAVSPFALEDSVILVDPDNGFEVASMSARTAEKYLRYAELASLYEAMGERSVLLAYQHWARVKREVEFDRISQRIKDVLPDAASVACVSSGSIGFFAIAKTRTLGKPALGVMREFASARGFAVYPTEQGSIF